MTFDKFRKKYYNGDTDKALACLAKEGYTRQFDKCPNRYVFKEMIDSLSTELAKRYMVFYNQEVKKNPERMRIETKLVVDAMFLGISKEDLLRAKENPYEKPMKNSLLILTIGALIYLPILVFLPTLARDRAVLGILFAVAPSVGMRFTNALYRYFKFKKLQDYYLKEEAELQKLKRKESEK